MLLDQSTRDGIQSGDITLVFRRWRRPTVRTGGTLLTAIGQILIRRVEPIDPSDITADEARLAGFADLATLLNELARHEGQLYRIELDGVRADPRHALREAVASDEELRAIVDKLQRLDRRAPTPWTAATLRLIQQYPGRRAGDLADLLGMERLPFKANVRKLKTLGLTISLEIGYELSPRGRQVIDRAGRD